MDTSYLDRYFLDAWETSELGAADAGSGLDIPAIWGDALVTCVDTSASRKATAHPYSPICIAAPFAMMVIYQEGAAGLMYSVTVDYGATWTAPALISSRTDVYASAVADPVTNDIHVVYSRWGDPTLGDDVWYRTLTYTASPVWRVSNEITLSFGALAAGYRNAVLSGAADGKLQVLALRKTATTRDWAQFTAQAPWTLQNAVETPSVLPASGNDKVSMIQVGAYTFVLARAGGSLVLYRATDIAWGANAVAYTSIEQWVADESEGFSLAGNTYAALDVGMCYIYNGRPYFRRYEVDGTLISGPTQVCALTGTLSADITWDGYYYRMYWIRDDGVITRTIYWATEQNWAALFLYQEDATGEEWDWINTPSNSLPGAIYMIAWSQTDVVGGPNCVYTGTLPLITTRPATELGEGLDAVSMLGVVSLTPESGVGTDSMQLILPLVEAGSGLDVLLLNLLLDDVGLGIEIYDKLWELFETGVGTEALANILPATLLEYGLGVELEFMPGVLTADVGVGDEGPPPYIPWIFAAEVGSGADALLLNLPVAEAGAGVDTYGLLLLFNDPGSGTDVAAILHYAAEVGAAAEIVGFASKQVLEAGTGAEYADIRLFLTDAGVSAEVARILITLADTGAGLDTASYSTAALVLAALRLLVGHGRLRLRVIGPGG